MPYRYRCTIAQVCICLLQSQQSKEFTKKPGVLAAVIEVAPLIL